MINELAALLRKARRVAQMDLLQQGLLRELVAMPILTLRAMMSKDLIEKARKFAALADKATPGPWYIMGYALRQRGSGCRIAGFDLPPDVEEEDLIAAAPDMAKLLAEMADELERTRKALRILADAADPFLANQSQATDERVALVQPVTVKEVEELNAAYREAREVLENADLD